MVKKRITGKEPNPWTRWFFVGQTGSGKTTAASTFPNPIFLVPENENSDTTLDDRGVEATVWTIESMDDMSVAVADLVSMYHKAPNDFWDSVMLESLTHYGDMIISGLTNDSQTENWGQFGQHLSKIHGSLATLECHLVYTAQAQIDEHGKASTMIQGRSSVILPSACDGIGYCEARIRGEKQEYWTYFKRYRGFPARSRRRWVPDEVQNFNFMDLYATSGL
jgi:hypothetical protein